MRGAVSAFIVALPALILTRQWVEAVTGAGVGWFGATEAALVGGVVGVVVLVALWASLQQQDADLLRFDHGMVGGTSGRHGGPAGRCGVARRTILAMPPSASAAVSRD